MKTTVRGQEIEIRPNSKPYLLKRFLSDGADIALIFLLFMTLTALFMKLPISESYRVHEERSRVIVEKTAGAYGNDAGAVAKALSENEEYRNETFAANLHSYLLKALSALLSEIPGLLIIPLLNRYRLTPGKMMTGVMPFHVRRQGRIMWYQVLYRFLFVFVIDSLLLYLLTGIYTFLLVPVLRLSEMLLNRKNKTLCDLVTGVMIIEKVSYDGIN